LKLEIHLSTKSVNVLIVESERGIIEEVHPKMGKSITKEASRVGQASSSSESNSNRNCSSRH
jgi:hypothetical protein